MPRKDFLGLEILLRNDAHYAVAAVEPVSILAVLDFDRE